MVDGHRCLLQGLCRPASAGVRITIFSPVLFIVVLTINFVSAEVRGMRPFGSLMLRSPQGDLGSLAGVISTLLISCHCTEVLSVCNRLVVEAYVFS